MIVEGSVGLSADRMAGMSKFISQKYGDISVARMATFPESEPLVTEGLSPSASASAILSQPDPSVAVNAVPASTMPNTPEAGVMAGCTDGKDPYAGIPVDAFTPPPSAHPESVLKWTEAVKQMTREVRR